MISDKFSVIRRGLHSKFLNSFVPNHEEPDRQVVKRLFQQLQLINGRYIILTGAGVSTESGIPDYRSEGVGRFARSNQRPITFHQVVKNHSIRQRFWARNYVAYPTFANFQPNITHRLLSEWERDNRFYWLYTQNVDGLHRMAGSERIIEMHGTMGFVRCLKCTWRGKRSEFQEILRDLNPDYLDDVQPTDIAPDGDVDLPESKIKDFIPPECPECSHDVVLPDVVYFGDNLPVDRRVAMDERMDRADGLLILGSTISVQSACRIVKRMYDRKKMIAIVNIGTTCVDHMAEIRVSQSRCGEVLQQIDELFKDKKEALIASKIGLEIGNVGYIASIPSARPRQIPGEPKKLIEE